MPRFLLWACMCLPLLAGCGGAENVTIETLTEGVWQGQGGPELFLFEFDTPAAGHAGVVHTVADGCKRSEVPIVTLSLDGNRIEFTMATGVDYRGRVNLGDEVIRGGIAGPDGSLFEMDLKRVDAASVPGLSARPAEEAPYAWAQPIAVTGGWPVGTCVEADLPREGVDNLVQGIIAGEAGVLHSLLVIKGGELVVEEYFHGYGRETLHGIASCTKSVSSLLVGLALEQGAIENLDVPVVGYFPTCAADCPQGWERITLRHLLTMSMGLDWTDAEGINLHGTGPDLFREVLSRRPAAEPGAKWRYINADVNLLAGVIKQATGRHADEFASTELFAPLGITSFDWDYLEQDGYRSMDGSLRLRPRDMARLGALVLNGGKWNGRQVVSAEWMSKSTSLQIPTDDGPFGYGYLWWLTKLPSGTGALDIVFASGWGSQFISVFPELDMIVVTTGGNQDNGKNFAISDLISRHLLGSRTADR
ncbi:MAG: serine hydrolase [bacterium]|nr:serine hydrolase [bacterium]